MDRNDGPRPVACTPGKDGSVCAGLTVSQGICFKISLRIVKAIFGSQPGNGLDRFRDFAVPTISARQGLSRQRLDPFWRPGMEAFGLALADGLNRWNNGQITIYRKRSAQAVSVGAKREQELSGRAAAGESSVRGDVREITDSGLPDEQCGVPHFRTIAGEFGFRRLAGVAYFENGRFIPVMNRRAGHGQRVFQSPRTVRGNLWISDQNQGLFHLLGGSVVERIPWARLGRRDWATALFPDPVQGGLWLGFHDGGVAYFKDGQVRASYAGADGLGRAVSTTFNSIRDGTLWAATEGGLSRVKNGRVATLTSKNGLPCDAVHWVMEDDAHSFWLYMACGLVRIARSELDAWATDPKRTIQATVFDSSDGVRSHPFTIGIHSACRQVCGWQIVVFASRRRQRHRSASPCLQQTSAAGAHRASHRRWQDLLAELVRRCVLLASRDCRRWCAI